MNLSAIFDNIVPILAIGLPLAIPIVAILVSHQRKMMELMIRSQELQTLNQNPNSQAQNTQLTYEVQMLREEVRSLREEIRGQQSLGQGDLRVNPVATPPDLPRIENRF